MTEKIYEHSPDAPTVNILACLLLVFSMLLNIIEIIVHMHIFILISCLVITFSENTWLYLLMALFSFIMS